MNSITDAHALKQYLFKMRKIFHEYPEVAHQEINTKNTIIKELNKMKVDYELVGRNSIVAYINRNKHNKVLGFVTGMDALAIDETGQCAYPSKIAGKAHLCGHDIEMAILLSMLSVLKHRERTIKGQVVVIFEEASEEYSGLRPIFDSNVLPHIDYIYSLHAISSLNYNQASIRKGPRFKGNDVVSIVWQGIVSHSAKTSTTIDAVFVAALFTSNIQNNLTMALPSNSYASITVTKINGGSSISTIGYHCETILNIRYDHEESRQCAYQVINNYLHSIKIQHKIETTLQILRCTKPVINDEQAVLLALQAMHQLEDIIEESRLRALNESDSFAAYLDYYQGAIGLYGVGFVDKENYYNHHEYFNACEDGFVSSLAWHLEIVYQYFIHKK